LQPFAAKKTESSLGSRANGSGIKTVPREKKKQREAEEGEAMHSSGLSMLQQNLGIGMIELVEVRFDTLVK